MKPLKLEMSAFGPYAGVVRLDFREHLDAGLFGIYGPTGSGKSSIFSAISYALFGDSAKEKETGEMMVSDHAVPGTSTYVRFIFDLGSKRYHVYRCPRHKRKALKGDKLAVQMARADFYDATGLDVDEIDESNRGKLIVEKKVLDVNRAIREILGYDASQFRQIVLLPQGRFETFLKANTKDRASSLKALFDVSLYQKITDHLVQESIAASKQVQRQRHEMTGKLKGQGFETLDELEEAIASCEGDVKTQSDALEEIKARHKEALDALNAAREAVKKFDEIKVARSDEKNLKSVEPEVKEKKQRLKQARKVSALDEIQKWIEDVGERSKQSAHHMEVARKARQKAKTDLAEANTALETMKEDLACLTSLKEDLVRLRGLRIAFQSLTVQKKAFDEAEAIKKEAAKELKPIKAGVNVAKEEAALCEQAITSHHRDKESRGAAEKALEEARRAAKDAERKAGAEKALAEAQTSVERAEGELGVARETTRDAQSALNEAEAALSGAQAYHLASKLEEGVPCPVCGSDDHPAPASHEVAEQGLDAAFRDARDGLDAARSAENTASEDRAVAISQRDICKTRFEEMDAPTGPLDQARIDVRKAQDAISKLPASLNLEDLESKLTAARIKIEEAHQKREDLNSEISIQSEAMAAAAALIKDSRSSLPEGIDTLEDLECRITEAEEQVATIQNAEAEVRSKIESSKTAEVEAKTEYATAKGLYDEHIGDHKKQLARLEDQLTSMDIRMEEYHAMRLDVDTQAALEKEIDAFNEARAAIRDRIKRAEKAVEGVTKPDLENFAKAEEEIRDEVADLQKAFGSLTNHLTGITSLKSSLSEERAVIDAFEKETAALRALAGTFNGGNAAKMDLETFALGVMFDRVLTAANSHFGPMSGSRYQFVHSSAGVRKNRKLGLDIMIDDINTGKARPAETLSGGEMFMASLSLALGLSEVVERISGNVRLDTIFIDEGFGSLDGDDGSGTLDEVLNTLTELAGRSRAVGIISHVGRVREAIPNGFYVHKGNRGSRVESRVI